MRLALLSQWYDPEPGPAALPGVLARGLRDRGHHVDVVTGFPNYPTGRLAPGYRVRTHMIERHEGIDVHRTALYPSHGSRLASRLANFGSFGASALVYGSRVLSRADAVWVNYSPISVAPAMWAARLASGVPVVLHVADLWPDTVLASGFGGGRATTESVKVMNWWCTRMYASSEAIVHISEGVGEELAQRGVPREKLHYVPTWADETLYDGHGHSMRAELGIPDDCRVLLYAGSLGPAQGLETLIEAMSLVEDPSLLVLIAGSGVSELELRELATVEGSGRVRFIGRVPQQRMADLLATCDASYISLRDHPLTNMTMPSKTQTIMASGRPILAAASGDLATAVGAGRCGLVAPPDDATGVAAMLRQFGRMEKTTLEAMGHCARTYYEREFSSAGGVDKIENLLLTAAQKKHQEGADGRR